MKPVKEVPATTGLCPKARHEAEGPTCSGATGSSRHAYSQASSTTEIANDPSVGVQQAILAVNSEVGQSWTLAL